MKLITDEFGDTDKLVEAAEESVRAALMTWRAAKKEERYTWNHSDRKLEGEMVSFIRDSVPPNEVLVDDIRLWRILGLVLISELWKEG